MMSDGDHRDKKQSHEDLAVNNIMRNADGRAFMFEHLQSCGVFESIFNENPYRHSYASGMRDAGLRLERKLKEAELSYYLKMVEENTHG